MGTSSPYYWPHRCRITDRLRKAEVGEEQTAAIRLAADRLTAAMARPQWKEDIREPIVTMSAHTTVNLCRGLRDVFAGQQEWPNDPNALARFVSDVCGDTDGIHESAIRKAVVVTVRQADPDVRIALATGGPLDRDLFCLIYQLFHRELLKELLMHFLSETALPVIGSVMLETALGEWAGERVAKMVPDPCDGKFATTASAMERGIEFAERIVDNLITNQAIEPENSHERLP